TIASSRLGQRGEQLDRRREMTLRLCIRRPRRRLLGREREVFDRLLRVAAAAVVVRDRAVVVFESRCEEPLDRPCRALVEHAAPIAEERGIGGLLGERVLENVLHAGPRSLFVEEFARLERREPAAQLLVGLARDLPRELDAGPSSYDRQRLQQRLGREVEPVDACGKHLLYASRQADAGERAALEHPL